MHKYEQLKGNLKNNQHTWLITGVTGFVGSNLLKTLLQLDQKVIGLDNFSTDFQQNPDEAKDFVGNGRWQQLTFIEGDICNLEDCQKACKGADFILHQVALGSVPRSLEDLIAANENNIDGFLSMLVTARGAKVQRFVYAASSSTYGDHPDLPKVKDKIGNPLPPPHAANKLVNELYAKMFARTCCFNTIDLRYFGIFGKHQDLDGAYAAVIPKWTSAMLKGETVYINGDGTTSRDPCHTGSTLQANLLAATTNNDDTSNQVYNVASHDRTSLNELFTLIQDELRRIVPDLPTTKPTYRDFRAGDVLHSLADISKAKELLGYEPFHTITQGMKEAMAWYVARIQP